MLTKLTKVSQEGHQGYRLREVYINPASVVMMGYLAPDALKSLKEGLLPQGVDPRVEFTELVLDNRNGGSLTHITVVGAPQVIESKLRNTRQLLKG